MYCQDTPDFHLVEVVWYNDLDGPGRPARRCRVGEGGVPGAPSYREKGDHDMPKLYRTDIASEANLKVYVTDIRSDADLVVYEAADAWVATEPQIWYYTDIQNEADKIVYFTDMQFEAALVVYKTDIQSDAEWQNSAKADLL
jgi:hypothetical protein